MWYDPTYTEIKSRSLGSYDLTIAKTTYIDGCDTYHLSYGCSRMFSGTLKQCESEWRKYVRCINKTLRKRAKANQLQQRKKNT